MFSLPRHQEDVEEAEKGLEALVFIPKEVILPHERCDIEARHRRREIKAEAFAEFLIEGCFL